jgi:HD superfamily phosphodiesterase
LTYDELVRDESVRVYIEAADRSLFELGYTEHSFAHVMRVSTDAAKILSALDYPAHDVELAKIAGYLHDIGNLVNRIDHSQSGAVMVFRILDRMQMPAQDIAAIVTAIGNHDEGTGIPVNPISAALIIADKSDVRRSRVRNTDISSFDIHDRVNYSVESSTLSIDSEQKEIRLHLTIDTKISPVMDYFEIFLGRMMMCRKAAERLQMRFRLYINGQALI